jgi:hypothetical protein
MEPGEYRCAGKSTRRGSLGLDWRLTGERDFGLHFGESQDSDYAREDALLASSNCAGGL